MQSVSFRIEIKDGVTYYVFKNQYTATQFLNGIGVDVMTPYFARSKYRWAHIGGFYNALELL